MSESEKKTELQKRDILRMSNEDSNHLTKECLQTALIYLMNEKPFEKITITELVKRSGVSRSAFYRNYSSKEDIVCELCNTVSHALEENLKKVHSKEELYHFFVNAFQKIQEEKEAFRLLLQANLSNNSFVELIFCLETIFPVKSPDEHYKLLALQGAFQTVLVHWFEDGMKESVEFMADFCTKLFE